MNSDHLAKALQAEFVIQHRAGGHDATDWFLAGFIANTLGSSPITKPTLMLPLDLALIRWSVVCEKWEQLANGSAPNLGAFLAGWYMRCVGLPQPEQHHILRDSLRAGWAHANDQIAIKIRETKQQLQAVGGQAERPAGDP
jgi:hypothetical protein